MIASVQGGQEPRWEDVQLFLALYRERTLAAAAKSVSLDASTLSRRLASLEEALGLRLFDRTREGLIPLEAAEMLLPAAEEMAHAHARFSRDASSFERVPEGTVRLSVPPGLAESFVAPALTRLRRKYPLLRIELDVSMNFVELTRREADLAVRTRRPQTGDLVSVKLGERQWTPMQAARQAKRGATKEWGDLLWITWGDDMASFPPARWIAEHVPRTSIVFRTSHFTTQVAAVTAGLGVALLPPAYARVSRVAPVRLSHDLADSAADLPTSETWLVGHRALRTVPRVSAVWTFLIEEFSRFEPAGSAASGSTSSRST